jgi:hypothetical protein
MLDEAIFAIILTQDEIEYLLDHLEPIAQTDEKMEKILRKFDETALLDDDGNFIVHP